MVLFVERLHPTEDVEEVLPTNKQTKICYLILCPASFYFLIPLYIFLNCAV